MKKAKDGKIELSRRFGNKLKAARKKYKVTQKEVARWIEVSPTTISNIERFRYGTVKEEIVIDLLDEFGNFLR